MKNRRATVADDAATPRGRASWAVVPAGDLLVLCAGSDTGLEVVAFTEPGRDYSAETARLLNRGGAFPLSGSLPKADRADGRVFGWAQLVAAFVASPSAENWTAIDAIPLVLRGTPFLLSIWEAMRKIPLGETMTYGELALAAGQVSASGKPKARPCGGACNRNRIAIIIPCHRVLPAGNTGVGQYGVGEYEHGAAIKATLLKRERVGVEAAREGAPAPKRNRVCA